ncbi:hypothetical protein [Roseibium sediminicola]|uniref:Uncharacterized protein n=1 Tax=Roseibium sediminicola TaxID=2933272 RepID=A0ABT0H086_9HYPH|nr:hypothetical protein [Roseibium sp. CAU 1639]MCK7614500.1 hypothetical protein [Roseibium sp. CAU 1639]
MPELKQLTAHMNAARSRVGKAMWYMVLSQTVVDMLAQNKVITRAALLDQLKANAGFEGNSDNLKEAYQQAAHLIEVGTETPVEPAA